MAKRSMTVEIEQTPPRGRITHANPPIPVSIRIVWTLDLKVAQIDDAWAIAWTRQQVCVYFFTMQMPNPAVVWIDRRQVRRHTPGA